MEFIEFYPPPLVERIPLIYFQISRYPIALPPPFIALPPLVSQHFCSKGAYYSFTPPPPPCFATLLQQGGGGKAIGYPLIIVLSETDIRE